MIVAYQKAKSLIYQVKERLDSMDAMGQSKYKAKIEAICSGTASSGHIDYGNKIYSFKTKKAYLDHCCHFAKWVRETHGCKTLEDARRYADEYLSVRLSQGCTAPTLKLDRAALAKLYGEHAGDFRALPIRHRADIKRGRTMTQNRSEFHEERHLDLIDFARATGLRRVELEKLRVRDICDRGDLILIEVHRGKGGKDRTVTADSDFYDRIREIVHGANADTRVCNLFDGGDGVGEAHIPRRAPMHSYRRDFAQKMYTRIARDTSLLSERAIYRCRKDMYGCVFDRAALKAVSVQLGHSRVNVIAEHYMR